MGGSKTTTKTETKPVDIWLPEQQQLFKKMYEWIEPRVTSGWGQTPEEQEYLEWLSTYPQQMEATLKPIYEAFPTKYQEWINQLYAPGVANQWLQQTLIPQWQQYIEPQVKAAYAGPGYWGQARAEAIRRSLQDLYSQAGNVELQNELMRRQLLTAVPELEVASKEQLTGLGQVLGGYLAEKAQLTNPMYSPYWAAASQLLSYQPRAVGTQSTTTQSGGGFATLLAPIGLGVGMGLLGYGPLGNITGGGGGILKWFDSLISPTRGIYLGSVG